MYTYTYYAIQEADGLLTMPYVEPVFRFKFADAGMSYAIAYTCIRL